MDRIFHLQVVQLQDSRSRLDSDILFADGPGHAGHLYTHNHNWQIVNFCFKKKMKRTQLRSKDISKELEHFKIEISKKDQVELIKHQKKIIMINKKPSF